MQAWRYLTDKPCSAALKIQVTDSPDRCIVMSETSGQTAGWQPAANDLTADDWKAVH